MRSLFLSVLLVLQALFVGDLSAEPPKQTTVVIAGAGLSGLATAAYLKKAGVPYHVLEISPRIGGRVRTVKYTIDGQEYSVDSGMEEYWESNPAVQFLKELKLDVSSDVAISSIVLDGKLNALGDENKAEFLKKILGEDGYRDLQRFEDTVRPILAQLKPGVTLSGDQLGLKDRDFASWVKDQKLSSRTENWIRVSLECEIGTEWSRISALDGIAEYHIFMGKGDDCYRVHGGNQKFTDALAHHIGDANISVNERVTRVVSKDSGIEVTYQNLQTNEYHTINARYFVSTIPLFRLFEVQFEPPLSTDKEAAIQSQKWGSYFKAHIFLPKSAEHYWTVNGSSILPILSDSPLGVIYGGESQKNRKLSILSLLITGGNAEGFNYMPLDQVRDIVKAALGRLWPGIEKEVVGIEFHRLHPRAIAAWPPGRSRFDDLSNAIRTPENGFYFAGDFTETSHSDGAFISAERVSSQIIAAEKGNPPAKALEGRKNAKT